MNLRSPKSYSYKREIVIKQGDFVFLQDLKIYENDMVKMSLKNKDKIINITYDSIYTAIEDGWNLE